MIPLLSFYFDDYHDDGDSLFYRNNMANNRRLTGHFHVMSLSVGHFASCIL